MNFEKNKMTFSPMIRQYLEIKEKHPDTLLFYRVGDFYEMFFQDVLIASKELEIVLTGKDGGVAERIPMCGVPYHSVSSYIDLLTSKGYKVGIVDQVEDPRFTKGIVKREITRIITPGTVIDEESLKGSDNNYLVSLSKTKENYVLSYLDITTGAGYITNIPLDDYLLITQLINLKTKEIIIEPLLKYPELEGLKNFTNFTLSYEENITCPNYFLSLLDGLTKDEAINYTRLLNYVARTQMRTLVHLQKVERVDFNNYLKIDFSSRRNLELLETLRFQSKKNTLFSLLDKTATAMGSRYLKQSILYPLIDIKRINERYDIISKMKKNYLETSELYQVLSEIYDLERIVGRVSYNNANPRDLLQLKKSLKVLPQVKFLLSKIGISKQYDFSKYEEAYLKLYKQIEATLNDDAPYTLKDGHVIKFGFNAELDNLRLINKSSKDYILALEAKERERTGIKQLKIGYNKVFGYYIEVSKLNSELISDDFGYIRKQTLSNAERYITQELKEKETQILHAEERAIALEISLFDELREEVKLHTNLLQKLAKMISEVDMMQALTKVANENKYVRPTISENGELEIKLGRHPVMEVYNKEPFIANDLTMEKEVILLITGPNMSGKSTYMRQIALIAIMAQMGSFVPAKQAKLPLFDQIFTRIGAADDIISGQSTFMVEMVEVNFALTYATEKSLIIFDEIGRGTATYDGMALAQAIIEYIHDVIKAKTLFSTHYHELTSLEVSLNNLKNVHVAAEEEQGDLIFVHKVLPGAVDKSYGINVARLAHLPLEVVLRASDLLNKLQKEKNYDEAKLSPYQYVAPLIYDSKTELETAILQNLQNLDVQQMTPIAALNYLDELKRKLKK